MSSTECQICRKMIPPGERRYTYKAGWICFDCGAPTRGGDLPYSAQDYIPPADTSGSLSRRRRRATALLLAALGLIPVLGVGLVYLLAPKPTEVAQIEPERRIDRAVAADAQATGSELGQAGLSSLGFPVPMDSSLYAGKPDAGPGNAHASPDASAGKPAANVGKPDAGVGKPAPIAAHSFANFGNPLATFEQSFAQTDSPEASASREGSAAGASDQSLSLASLAPRPQLPPFWDKPEPAQPPAAVEPSPSAASPAPDSSGGDDPEMRVAPEPAPERSPLDALIDIGSRHLVAGDLKAAKEVFDSALAQSSKNERARVGLAIIQHFRGNTQQAIDALEAMHREKPSRVVSVNLAAMWYQRNAMRSARILHGYLCDSDEPPDEAAFDYYTLALWRSQWRSRRSTYFIGMSEYYSTYEQRLRLARDIDEYKWGTQWVSQEELTKKLDRVHIAGAEYKYKYRKYQNVISERWSNYRAYLKGLRWEMTAIENIDLARRANEARYQARNALNDFNRVGPPLPHQIPVIAP